MTAGRVPAQRAVQVVEASYAAFIAEVGDQRQLLDVLRQLARPLPESTTTSLGYRHPYLGDQRGGCPTALSMPVATGQVDHAGEASAERGFQRRPISRLACGQWTGRPR